MNVRHVGRLVSAILFVVVAAGCRAHESAPHPNDAVTLDALFADRSAYIGRQTTVRGTLTRADTLTSGAKHVRVVWSGEGASPLDALVGRDVRVDGKVGISYTVIDPSVVPRDPRSRAPGLERCCPVERGPDHEGGQAHRRHELAFEDLRSTTIIGSMAVAGASRVSRQCTDQSSVCGACMKWGTVNGINPEDLALGPCARRAVAAYSPQQSTLVRPPPREPRRTTQAGRLSLTVQSVGWGALPRFPPQIHSPSDRLDRQWRHQP